MPSPLPPCSDLTRHGGLEGYLDILSKQFCLLRQNKCAVLTATALHSARYKRRKGRRGKELKKTASYSMDFSHNISSDLYSSGTQNWTSRVRSNVSIPTGPDKHLFFTTNRAHYTGSYRVLCGRCPSSDSTGQSLGIEVQSRLLSAAEEPL